MPRFNNEGRSSKFVHMRGGGGGKQFDDERSKFKFTLNKGGIQRKNRDRSSAFSRLDATGDTLMDPEDAGGSGRAHVHFDATARRGKRHVNKSWRKNQGQAASRDTHSFGPTWHKITIVNGKGYDKVFILSALGQICRTPFFPICYSTFGVNTAFYVDERGTAEALAECSGKVLAPDGTQKIFLRVNSCGAPQTAHIDEECERRIKEVLDKRYNASLHTLSLENFWMSPELVTDYFLPMYRPSVIQKLSEFLQPHLDSIVGLDLSNNKLPALDFLAKIINKATALKALNLRGNKIREFSSLDRISAPSIVELILEGNPVWENTEDKEAYIRSSD